MTVINTNTAALTAQANMKKVAGDLDTAMERLSSGMRINSSADDAAGLSIMTRMESQVRGLNMAMRNAADGISLTQSAEGAMDEVTNILQRMRELSVQASNGTFNDSDRVALQAEVTQLSDELDRIAETTQFNDQNILDGSYSGNLNVTGTSEGNLAVNIGSVAASSLGARSDGPAQAAELAKLDFGGISTTASDYQGANFTVTVDGVDAAINLPTTNGINPTSASVSALMSGEDRGPATSMILGNKVYTGAGINGFQKAGTVNLADKSLRTFEMRVNDTAYLQVDITSALSNILGVDENKLNAPETFVESTSDEVTQAQFMQALNDTFASMAELSGDNAVTASVNQYGQIDFTAGGDNFVSMRETTDGFTSSVFVETFVHNEHTMAATAAQITQPMNAVDLTDNRVAAFNVTVNDGPAVDIEYWADLNDSSKVADRSAVTLPELTRILQSKLDENFSGANKVTVGFDESAQAFTFQVAGGAQKIQFAEVAAISDGSAAQGTGVNSLLGDTTAIDNNANIINFTTNSASNINSVVNDYDNEDFVFTVAVNGKPAVDISMVSYIRENVSDLTAATGAEMEVALQKAFDDNFTGDDKVTVKLGSNGALRFTVDGGAQHLAISEYNDGAASDFAATVLGGASIIYNGKLTKDSQTLAAGIGEAGAARYSASTRGPGTIKFQNAFGILSQRGDASGEAARVTVFNDVDGVEPVQLKAENTRALVTGNPLVTAGVVTTSMDVMDAAPEVGQSISIDYIVGGTAKTKTLSFSTAGSSSTNVDITGVTTAAALATAIAASLNADGDFDSSAAGNGVIGAVVGSGSDGNNRITFTVGKNAGSGWLTGDGIVGVRTNSDATDGIVVGGSNDQFDLTVGDQTATGLTITQGTYANVEAYAAEIQRVINADGQFREENAVTVVVKEGTLSSNTEETVKYIALENASGKLMTIGKTAGDTGEFFFGTENDSSIANTNILASLKDELGLTADTTNYVTSGKIDGGVDTTQDGGFVSVTIEDGDTTITRAVAVTQEATRTFDDFAGDLGTAINAAFAADGYSVSVSSTNGNFSMALDQAGAKTISLTGAIVEDAFGSSVSATGSDGEGAAFTSMQDVVAAINDDLAAAGGNAEASFANGVMSIQAKTGTAGAASSIAVSGADLDVLQFGAERAATGYAGNAEAATIDQINIGTVDGAENALSSIDNAIAFVNSQRANLGAIENRLDHTINNLSNVVVNTEASKSRIADADFAVETGALTKAQVLSQAATAMLAQANASKQSVLSLLQ